MTTITAPAPNPEVRLRLMRRKILEWLRSPPHDKTADPLLAKQLPEECSILCDAKRPMLAMALARSDHVFVYVVERLPVCTVSVEQLTKIPEHGVERWLAKTAQTIERTQRISDICLPKRFIRSMADRQQVVILRRGDSYSAYGIEQPVFRYTKAECMQSL